MASQTRFIIGRSPPDPVYVSLAFRPTPPLHLVQNPFPPPADYKTWQWAVIHGTDSPGCDIERFSDGSLTPEDMMLKCYEWERTRPGLYTRCFNTAGWAKNKLACPTTLRDTNSQCDLYIRVLIDDSWYFRGGRDHPGNDFDAEGFRRGSTHIDIVDSLLSARDNSRIVCFNTEGCSKHALSGLKWLSRWTMPHQGVWIRKGLWD